MNQIDEPILFILSWNRPIYLWVCLDSIYRHTKSPKKVVIVDNNSSDPLVFDVINGFQKRGLFYKVHLYSDNDPFRFEKIIHEYWNEIGDYFVLIEADIEILPCNDGCWLNKMKNYMDQNENLASVGSRVYLNDFVDIKIAKQLEPDMPSDELKSLIKADAPMRKYIHSEEKLIDPHNAPLRLILIRKTAYEKIKFGRDTFIYKQFKDLGYDAKISTEIVHRHLSLLNIFDYPDHSFHNRESFFNCQKK
jgi:GT2 family glycosyltransferase